MAGQDSMVGNKQEGARHQQAMAGACAERARSGRPPGQPGKLQQARPGLQAALPCPALPCPALPCPALPCCSPWPSSMRLMVEMALLRAFSVSTTPGVTIMSRYLRYRAAVHMSSSTQ